MESSDEVGDFAAATSHDQRPNYIVGIGASAGGLEALDTFFSKVPSNTGLAFVVVQHLSPDFKSLMNELLARHTSMPIFRAEDGMVVRPNALYLIPPRKELVIADGKLQLTDSDPGHSFTLPIDVFFRSLAQDAKDHAIGIILTGTGSDGSRGIGDIRREGGVVLVQSPETAKFDGMPRAAIATGFTDAVLPVDEIAATVVRYAKDPKIRAGLSQSQDSKSSVPDQAIDQLFDLLKDQYQVDFSQYKPSTIARRIERRMTQRHAQTIEAYLDYVAKNRSELDQLYRDLLIGVTTFFRDSEAFYRLETEVIPRLLENATDQHGLRIWVPGCATGEEAYSLAILLHEHALKSDQLLNVKIFATDVHPESLEIASLGTYSGESIEGVSEERLERYFSRYRDRFQVSPDLRRMVVFTRHDVLRDPPFTKLDMISCRNLMIYFHASAQERLLEVFHIALKRHGVLFMGPSESLAKLQSEFETINHRWQIHRKRRDIRLSTPIRFSPSRIGQATTPDMGPGFPRLGFRPFDRQLLHAYDVLLSRYMPPSALINERGELVHTFGEAARYFRPMHGRFSSDLIDLVDGDVRIALAVAFPRARKEAKPVTYRGVTVSGEDGPKTINLVVEMLPDTPTGSRYFLVTFEESQPSSAPRHETSAFDVAGESNLRISDLERELQYTRINLQTTVEELETSNEELQGTNEELMALNQELQSTNEELHSVNEELYTVNAEHQSKIEELTQLSSDMDNLLMSTDIGTIFLDGDLNIRKFTPAAAKTFNLLDRDIGRPLVHMTHQIDYEHVPADAQSCLETSISVEREVRTRSGEWMLMRVHPYRSGISRTEGVVLTFVDVSKIKLAQQALQDSEQRLRAQRRHLELIIDNVRDGLLVVDHACRVTIANPTSARILGTTMGALLQHPLLFERFPFYTPDDRPLDRTQGPFHRALMEDLHPELELMLGQPDNGERKHISVTGGPVRDDTGEVKGAVIVMRDVSERKKGEILLKRANEDLEIRVRERTAALEEEKRKAEEANAAKTQFLARMSHELRTPLNAIMGFSETVAMGVFDGNEGKYKEYAAHIHASGEHLLALINDLLDLSRIESGKFELTEEYVSFRELVEDAFGILEPYSVRHGIMLQSDCAHPDSRLLADRRAVRQMLSNLLSNAIKFSPENSVVVTSTQLLPDGKLAIKVTDNGYGIAEGDIPKVLLPFGQAGDPRIKSEKGTGLGLAIVRSLVGLHGGTISIDSAPGKGTTVTLTFPRWRVRPQL